MWFDYQGCQVLQSRISEIVLSHHCDEAAKCNLISSYNKPGVRPIEIGDVHRRIPAKAILAIVSDDIQLAAGALQTWMLVLKLPSMLWRIWEDTEVVIFVGANNAFNRINRQAALHNINTYVHHLALFYITPMAYPSDYLLRAFVYWGHHLLQWVCMP